MLKDNTIIYLSKSVEYPTLKVNPNVNCYLYMAMRFQCMFILGGEK